MSFFSFVSLCTLKNTCVLLKETTISHPIYIELAECFFVQLKCTYIAFFEPLKLPISLEIISHEASIVDAPVNNDEASRDENRLQDADIGGHDSSIGAIGETHIVYRALDGLCTRSIEINEIRDNIWK